ncbi:MAG TPA: YdcF family protein [Gemmatimonadaceae bacterium]|nr:YdcF family protein [Gemmatimonadaceae bacterium]
MEANHGWRRIATDALTGAIIAILVAVGAHSLGVQDLIRRPDLALYLPAGIVGAVIGPTRLRALLWMLAAPVALLILAVVYTPLVSWLAEPLVRRDQLPSGVDAIATLSQGVTPAGAMRSGTLERLLSGLTLTRELPSSALLVSVERRTVAGHPVSDSADVRAVVGGYAHSADVFFVDSVFTTRTEALRMRQVAWPKGWRTLAVVTSPLHTRRACATFEAVGFRVVCVPSVSREHIVPAASSPRDRLRTFRAWIYEIFAAATYKSNGWIR